MEQELEEFYESILSGKGSHGTITQYRLILNDLVEFLNKLSVNSWSNVTSETLLKYKIYLSKRRSLYSPYKILNELTQLQHWACIRGFFTFLNDIKGVKNDSAKIVFNDLKPKNEPSQDYLTPEEMDKLWRFSGGDLLQAAIVSTIFFTGIRHSELINMTLDSVSFKEEEITVTGKGNRTRRIYIVPELQKDLKKYLKVRQVHDKENHFFLNYKGLKMSYNDLSYMFTKLKDCIPRIYPHLLRHTFATYLMETGSSIVDIQKKLGHQDIRTTQRYIHETEQSKELHRKLAKYYKTEKEK